MTKLVCKTCAHWSHEAFKAMAHDTSWATLHGHWSSGKLRRMNSGVCRRAPRMATGGPHVTDRHGTCPLWWPAELGYLWRPGVLAGMVLKAFTAPHVLMRLWAEAEERRIVIGTAYNGALRAILRLQDQATMGPMEPDHQKSNKDRFIEAAHNLGATVRHLLVEKVPPEPHIDAAKMTGLAEDLISSAQELTRHEHMRKGHALGVRQVKEAVEQALYDHLEMAADVPDILAEFGYGWAGLVKDRESAAEYDDVDDAA